jgi:hypothetical protein
MGDLSDVLSRKLNLKAGQKLNVKKTTQPRRAHETEDDVAVLSLIMPGESFTCHLAEDCLYSNPQHNSLGSYIIGSPCSNKLST